MKTVILCGGLGTRLSEETIVKPKPMVEVGNHPILWHILKIYESYGYSDFVLALGYKGDVIKDYFLNYRRSRSDITVELGSGGVSFENTTVENWTVRMIETGDESMTGGRLHRLASLLRSEDTFMLTYGDGVADVDIDGLIEFHKNHGKLATVTAVRPPARFGTMIFDGSRVAEFKEKPQTGEGWINGGFYVFQAGVLDYLSGDETILEHEPLENLASDGELMAYRHDGFWKCMDTLRDKQTLESIWMQGDAPWKKW